MNMQKLLKSRQNFLTQKCLFEDQPAPLRATGVQAERNLKWSVQVISLHRKSRLYCFLVKLKIHMCNLCFCRLHADSKCADKEVSEI